MYKEYLNTALNESLKTFEARSRNNIPKRKLKESTNSGMPRKVTVEDLIDTYDGNEMVYDQATGLTEMHTTVYIDDEPAISEHWDFDGEDYPQYFGTKEDPNDDWDEFLNDPEIRDIMQEFADKLNKEIAQEIEDWYEPGVEVLITAGGPKVYLTEGMRRKNIHHKSIHEAKKTKKK